MGLKDVLNKINKSKSKYNLDQFSKGMGVESEHGSVDPETDVTHDDPIKTGKIVVAHLKESPTYYTALENMEKNESKKNDKLVNDDKNKDKWSNKQIKTVKRLTYRKARSNQK